MLLRKPLGRATSAAGRFDDGVQFDASWYEQWLPRYRRLRAAGLIGILLAEGERYWLGNPANPWGDRERVGLSEVQRRIEALERKAAVA